MKTIYKIMSVLVALPVVLLFLANGSGSAGGYSGSPGDNNQTCTACHSGTPTVQTGWISSNIPVSGYVPGSTYQLTLNANQTGVSKFGFEFTSENSSGQKTGTFTITDANRTKLTNQNKSVTHKSGGTAGAAGGTISWTFNWTAPATSAGQVRFYAAVNATNSNGNTSGDQIIKTSLFVEAAAPAALLAVSPQQADQGSSATLTITGQNTSWNATSPAVQLRKSGTTTTIAPATVTVNNNTQLQASFNFAPNALPGLYDVLVNDLVLAESFTINQIVPALLTVQPNVANQGENVVVEITAENTFWNGTTPTISLSQSGSATINATAVTVLSNTTASATFQIPADANTGLYNLGVNDLLMPNAFTINLVSGIANVSASSFKFYPNPATSFVTIETKSGSIVRIFDLNEKKLIEKVCFDIYENIDLSQIEKGVYIIHVQHDGKNEIRKLIKK
ncbi:MAG TPA: T9SS type A sorting domain-containing protein [Bacteroidales bacterium]|nr:T9SS type A sorting domain-containing protein [Bacteroidales bacterium]